MSSELRHVIGTDSTYLFPVLTTDEEAFAAAKLLDPKAKEADFQTPTDLTGAFFYFEIFDASDPPVPIIRKDNDPAGINLGITFRVPESGGLAEVRIEHQDLPGATPGDRLPYIAKVRLDPAGADDRFRISAGAIQVLAEELIVA